MFYLSPTTDTAGGSLSVSHLDEGDGQSGRTKSTAPELLACFRLARWGPIGLYKHKQHTAPKCGSPSIGTCVTTCATTFMQPFAASAKGDNLWATTLDPWKKEAYLQLSL